MSARRSETAILFRALMFLSCALAGRIALAQTSTPAPPGPGGGGTYYPAPPTPPPFTPPATPAAGPPIAPLGSQFPGESPPPGQAGAPPNSAPPSTAGDSPTAAGPPTAAGQNKSAPKVVEIRLVGNRRVTRNEIISKLRTKVGRDFDQSTLEKDVRALATWGKFIDVKTRKEPTPDGVIIIIEVIERPTLEYVKFLGHKKVGRMALAKQVDLKQGSPLEPYAIEEGKRKLEEYYRGKGFNDVHITILEGTQPNDHGAVYLIHEGPPQKIAKVNFVGNNIATDGRLKTQIQSKPPILWLFKGEVDRKKIEEDKERLTAYYRGLGFFRAKVGAESDWNAAEDRLSITFVIDEGPRARVRAVKLLGNSTYSSEQLMPGLELKQGDWFDETKMVKDVTTLRDLYGGQGYVFCDVQKETRVIEDATAMDMVYTIVEGGRYRVSRINIHIESTDTIYPHTSQRTVLNRLSLHPGDIIDVNKLRQDERRLKASRLFSTDPSKGRPPIIVFTAPDSENPDGGESVARKPKKRGRGNGSGSGGTFRGQSPDPDDPDETPEVKSGFWRLLSRPKSADDVADSEPETDEEKLPPWKRIYAYELEPVPAASKAGAPRPVAPPAVAPQSNVAPPAIAPQSTRVAPQAVSGTQRSMSAAANTPIRLQPEASLSAPPSDLGVVDGAISPQSNDRPFKPSRSVPGRQPAAMIPSVINSADPKSGVSPVSYLAPANSPGAASLQAAEIAAPLEALEPATLAPPAARAPSSQGVVAPNATPVTLRPLNPNFGPPAPKKRYAWFVTLDSTPGWSNDFRPRWLVNPAPEQAGSQVFRGQDPGSGPPGGFNPGGAPGGGFGPGGVAPGAGPVSPVNETPPVREIPLDVIVTETQTGRLMFGAGVNSNAGLVGNITIDEQNFDWRRIPTSSEDWHNGTAFRGAGQRFNIQASPGTLMQRYSVSFAEPYLFDTPINFGLSGAYFQRYYQNWTEQRSGGRVATGYQITPDLSGSVAFSGDDVKISNPSNPSEPQLERVLGHSALLGVTGSLMYDTRDNTFLATQGRYYSVSIEQAFGTFVFPRAVLDVRRFFTLHQRPDGSGRHVLAVMGLLGAEGNNAPLYDHFFAGGIGTIRGFYYRGASPVDQGVIVGGTTEAMTTIEYVFPITADDMLRGTVFVDAGIIEPGFTYQPSSVRLAPGIGVLINVPALGPAPINVGIAIPVMRNPNDTLQYFYFSMGLGR